MGARLGQHFLRAAWVAEAVVTAAHIRRGDTVLEIGPGEGALTQFLLASSAARVIVVEKDSALVEHLRTRFADAVSAERLTIVASDIRDVTPEQLGLRPRAYVLAANIPYYITGEIIRTFLTAQAQPRSMALLIQKEVAERIARNPKESILSLSVKAYGTPKLECTVPKRAFKPAPKVDSAVLSISNISRAFFKEIDEHDFFTIVKTGFSSKRKLLLGNFKTAGFFNPELHGVAFHRCDVPPKSRAEDVTLAQWQCLTQQLGGLLPR